MVQSRSARWTIVTTVTLIATSLTCSAAEFHNIAPLRWIDPFNRVPLTRAEFLAVQDELAPLEDCLIAEIGNRDAREVPEEQRPNLVALYVETNLVSALQPFLDTYMVDLVAEGFSVQMHSLAGGTAQALRSQLQSLQAQGLVGTVLVGDLPCAWYELDDYWGGEHEEFPIDLYLMDLNGTWTDSDGDGLYDNHTGNVAPEIWLGRIDASRFMASNELSALQNYFAKNHAYRTGQITLPRRALAFDDDDWDYFGDSGLSAVYDNVTVINSSYQTTAANYRTQLLTGHEFVHLMSHSNPWGHSFVTTSGPAGCFFNFDLDLLSAQAFFYNLFACSNARFVELDNIGNYYLFQEDYGLAVIGSTKTGSMLDFELFYDPLAADNCLGHSFLLWFQAQAASGFDAYERSWFYGMTLLGDPTLLVNQEFERRRAVHGIAVSQNLPSDEPNRLLGTPLSSSESDGRPVLCSGPQNEVMAVWISGLEGRASICSNYYNGSSWGGQRLIQPYMYWEADPALAVTASGEFWIIFPRFLEDEYDYDLMSSRWTGGSWSTPQTLFRRDGYDLRPAVIAFNNNLHVAWQSWDNAQADVYWVRQNGTSWTTPVLLTESDKHDVNPQLLDDGNNRLWLVWSTRERGYWDVAYKVYSQLWSAQSFLTDDSVTAYNPIMASAGDGTLWLACMVNSNGASDLAAYHFNGANWVGPEWVTQSPEAEYAPHLVLNQGMPILTFYRKTTDRTLYLAVRQAGVWHTEILENSAGHDMDPTLAVHSAGTAWLAWCTNREGDTDVYAAQIPVPTPAETPSPEPTSVQTTTPVATATPSSSTTPDLTRTPTPDLIPTATWTASQVETVTPTPIGAITIDIQTSQPHYGAGDQFALYCSILSPSIVTVDHYIVLDVQGAYWFWPSWEPTLDFHARTCAAGLTTETILAFVWPEGAGQLQGVRFWTALLDQETSALLANLDYCDFSFE